MRVIGLMSGTSHDAIEVAAADLFFTDPDNDAGNGIDIGNATNPDNSTATGAGSGAGSGAGRDVGGPTVTAVLLGARTVELDARLRAAVASILPPSESTAPLGVAAQVCQLDTELGQAFAAAAELANRELCGGRADLVVSHGQTVYHWVEGGRVLGTLQLGAPAWIAERTGVPVVSDLRTRDITRGGQGAPLVSLFDRLLLPPAAAPRAAVNLGGIANLTVIPPTLGIDHGDRRDRADREDREDGSGGDAEGRGGRAGGGHRAGGGDRGNHGDHGGGGDGSGGDRAGGAGGGGGWDHARDAGDRAGGRVVAYDIGPANALIDATVTALSGGAETMDTDGRRARRGQVLPGLLDDLLTDPYYVLPPPKSTGKERFNGAYLARMTERHPAARQSGDDLVATLTELTAVTVANACAAAGAAEVVVSGGGTRNPALMDALARRVADRGPRGDRAGPVVRTIDALGIPSHAKEALAFALLGFLTVHGLPGTTPGATGAAAPAVLGSITPGNRPLRLPEPVARVPRRLLIASADTGTDTDTDADTDTPARTARP